MKYGKIIEGNLTIKKGDKNDYSEVEQITGYLHIDSNAKFKASNLQSVGGDLHIYSNAKFKALQSVGGDLHIYSNAKFKASNLQSVGGDLSIYSNAKFEALQSVGGYLHIDSNAKFKASNLQSVGDDLYIYSNAKFKASNLQSVGGDLHIYSNAKFEALQSVGGYLHIDSNAKFEASKAKFNVQSTREFALKFNFECFLKTGYLFADKILAKIISKRKNVYKIQICGKTKISYCIEIDGVFSHGDSIKKAKESLIYKISNRDTSMYKDYTLDTKLTKAEAIKMYRVITGACEAGTRNFVEHTKIPAKLTVKKMIELTEGQYGNKRLKEFMN